MRLLAVLCVTQNVSIADRGSRDCRSPRDRLIARSVWAFPKKTPADVRKDGWNSPHLKFTEASAIKIAHNDEVENGYIFYINVDNSFLLTELTRAKEEDKALLKYWFVWGLALCAMGILQDEKRRRQDDRPEDKDHDAGEEDLNIISRYCTGLARVIVPTIRLLYRGPQPGTT
jgi:hypothetical protein